MLRWKAFLLVLSVVVSGLVLLAHQGMTKATPKSLAVLSTSDGIGETKPCG
jgi:hypothetical protein